MSWNNTTDLSMDNLTDLQRRNLGSYVGKTPNYLIELTLYQEDAYKLQAALEDRGSYFSQRIAWELEKELAWQYEENGMIKLANRLHKEGKLKTEA